MAFHNLTFLSYFILYFFPSLTTVSLVFFHHTLLLQASYLSSLYASMFIISLFVRSTSTMGKQEERKETSWISQTKLIKLQEWHETKG